MLLLLQLAMLPRVDVTSSCKSRVIFEAGIGKMEDELLNLLFFDQGVAKILMPGDDEPCSVVWFSISLP
jgi:hypothetical protein